VDKHSGAICQSLILPTISVSVTVDNLFVVVCRPYIQKVLICCSKNDQGGVLLVKSSGKGGFFSHFRHCPQGMGIWAKLYPKSVGASVDKVFVLVCSPMKPGATEIWLKNIQTVCSTVSRCCTGYFRAHEKTTYP
jgi:hypothetical protein